MTQSVTTTMLAVCLGEKPGTVRQWIARGRIVRNADGSFDQDRLSKWLHEQRDTRKIPAQLRRVA